MKARVFLLPSCFLHGSRFPGRCRVRAFPVVLVVPLLLVTVLAAVAGAPDLLSRRLDAAAPPASGNDNSVSPRLTPDGRFVLFSSAANNLVAGDNSQMGLDVFRHDCASNTTVLVSVNALATGGGNDHSAFGQVSTNGRYAVFQSDATDLLPGDTNGSGDIFLRDVQLGATALVSVATNGGWANGASAEPALTPDGRWVAFVSAASNLAAGDSNGIPDLFVRDLVSGTTRWVSAGATGASAYASSPVITPDGRFVAFFSTARGLVAGVPSSTRGEIYLADLVANTMTWASTNAAVTTSNLLKLNNPPSSHPVLSDDGRYVAFKCGWTNGTAAPPSPGKAAAFVFRYDTLSATATVLTTNAQPDWPFNDDVYGPEMTPDGRFVAYVEREATGTATPCSVRLWDEQTGTNVLVSADLSGALPTNSVSHTPLVSADGRYVTFVSDATNLVANILSNGLHLYRRDLQTDTTALVDVDTNGIGSGDQTGVIPATSADGQVVVYATDDGGLVAGDTNKALDVFLWDATTGTNQLISARDPAVVAVSGNALSALSQLALSANGSTVAFASYASDLVTNDFNAEGDVFVQDLATGSNGLVSVGLDGNAALGGTSFAPLLSADGRYVVFLSAATNLVTGDTNLATDLFRRDVWSGTTTCESVNSSGTSLGNGDSSVPALSRDGRYVVFVCKTNVSGSTVALFWRDLDSSVTRLVNGSVQTTRAPSISGDGQRVGYLDASARLYVWDAIGQTNVYTNTTASLVSAALAPGGDKLLYQTSLQLFVRDLAVSTNQFLYPSTVQLKSAGQWSGDGRHFAFVTTTNLVPGDTNGVSDVYLRDLPSGTLTLLSLDQSGTGSADSASDSPTVSADGRFIAFSSMATNILPGIVRPPSLVLFDRVTGSNRLIATGTSVGWSAWVTRPALSTNGAVVAFQGWDDGLVSGDRNRVGDAFAGATDFVSLLDSDGDGIPDWWLNQYFGHASGQEGDKSRASDDADDDGLTNLEEFLTGTNPRDGASVLTLRVTLLAGNKVNLSWPASPGRNYQVLATADLSNPNWQSVSGAAVMGGLGSLTVSISDAQRYFRVLVGDN
jgi:Tol biopolymer transport system component